mgnify:CR=1 FL=1
MGFVGGWSNRGHFGGLIGRGHFRWLHALGRRTVMGFGIVCSLFLTRERERAFRISYFLVPELHRSPPKKQETSPSPTTGEVEGEWDGTTTLTT